MSQQYIAQAEITLNYLSSDELRDLLNDDEKLEERVNELVSRLLFCVMSSMTHSPELIFCDIMFAFFYRLHRWKMIKRQY